jgi:hypothetical protein
MGMSVVYGLALRAYVDTPLRTFGCDDKKILPDLEDLTGYIGKRPLPGGSLNKKDLTGFEYPTFGVQCKPVRSGV